MFNPFQQRTHRQLRAYKGHRWARYHWLKGQHIRRSYFKSFGIEFPY